jgi:hypothetical protein
VLIARVSGVLSSRFSGVSDTVEVGLFSVVLSTKSAVAEQAFSVTNTIEKKRVVANITCNFIENILVFIINLSFTEVSR